MPWFQGTPAIRVWEISEVIFSCIFVDAQTCTEPDELHLYVVLRVAPSHNPDLTKTKAFSKCLGKYGGSSDLGTCAIPYTVAEYCWPAQKSFIPYVMAF